MSKVTFKADQSVSNKGIFINQKSAMFWVFRQRGDRAGVLDRPFVFRAPYVNYFYTYECRQSSCVAFLLAGTLALHEVHIVVKYQLSRTLFSLGCITLDGHRRGFRPFARQASLRTTPIPTLSFLFLTEAPGRLATPETTYGP